MKALWKIVKAILIFTGAVNWIYVTVMMVKKAIKGPEPIVKPVMFMNQK